MTKQIRHMGTVEPSYGENDFIADDTLAFIYGAIDKYGAYEDLVDEVCKYIVDIIKLRKK